jgi:hypothetical protein
MQENGIMVEYPAVVKGDVWYMCGENEEDERRSECSGVVRAEDRSDDDGEGGMG